MATEETNHNEPIVESLIDLQRRLLQSKSPFVRRVGTLLAAGALDNHLSELNDHRIGQLLLDEVGSDLGIFEPEAIICHQATRRLFRSEHGGLVEEPSLRPPSPLCGNDMLFQHGIDESDFFECSSLRCEHREYALCDEP